MVEFRRLLQIGAIFFTESSDFANQSTISPWSEVQNDIQTKLSWRCPCSCWVYHHNPGHDRQPKSPIPWRWVTTPDDTSGMRRCAISSLLDSNPAQWLRHAVLLCSSPTSRGAPPIPVPRLAGLITKQPYSYLPIVESGVAYLKERLCTIMSSISGFRLASHVFLADLVF